MTTATRCVEVVNDTRARTLGTRVRVEENWWGRFRGLLGTTRLDEGEGLLLEGCRAIHTYGMGYSLDVVFLDNGGRVVGVHPHLAPGGTTPFHREAARALELPAGMLSRTGTRLGDRLRWSDAR